MGGAASKSTIVGNKSTLADLDSTLSDILTSTLAKYSELMEEKVSTAHKTHIQTFKKKGASLEAIPTPEVSIHDTFKGKCTNDVVVVIKNKLKRFPKWALVERGILFNGTKDIPFEIQDPQNMAKEALCQKMAELYTALLLSIEIVVKSLFACRTSIDALTARVDSSFTTKDNKSNDAVHDTGANSLWFKSMDELQKLYEKHAKEAKTLFNSLDSTDTLTSAEVDKFKQKLGELNVKMQSLPQQCSMMFDKIDRTPTIGQSLAEDCKRMGIDDQECSADLVRARNDEVAAKAALRDASLRATSLQ